MPAKAMHRRTSIGTHRAIKTGSRQAESRQTESRRAGPRKTGSRQIGSRQTVSRWTKSTLARARARARTHTHTHTHIFSFDLPPYPLGSVCTMLKRKPPGPTNPDLGIKLSLNAKPHGLRRSLEMQSSGSSTKRAKNEMKKPLSPIAGNSGGEQAHPTMHMKSNDLRIIVRNGPSPFGKPMNPTSLLKEGV